MRPILYSYFLSSASFRVRIALNLKNVDYEYRGVDLFKDAQSKEEYKQINKMQRVPSLIIDGSTLTESVAICEYLDETRNGPQLPRLLPSDPIKRAKVRSLVEIINSGIQPLQNLEVGKRLEVLSPGSGVEWRQYFVTKGLKAFENGIEDSHGKFCMGNEITMADVFLAAQFINCKRFQVDPNEFPLLQKIYKELIAHPDFEKAHPRNQPDFTK